MWVYKSISLWLLHTYTRTNIAITRNESLRKEVFVFRDFLSSVYAAAASWGKLRENERQRSRRHPNFTSASVSIDCEFIREQVYMYTRSWCWWLGPKLSFSNVVLTASFPALATAAAPTLHSLTVVIVVATARFFFKFFVLFKR